MREHDIFSLMSQSAHRTKLLVLFPPHSAGAEVLLAALEAAIASTQTFRLEFATAASSTPDSGVPQRATLAIVPEGDNRALELLSEQLLETPEIPLIAVIPNGKREIGIETVRRGASDFVELGNTAPETMVTIILSAMCRFQNAISLQHRRHFESTIASVTTTLMKVTGEPLTERVRSTLEVIANFSHSQHAVALLINDDKATASVHFEWCRNPEHGTKTLLGSQKLSNFQPLFDSARSPDTLLYYGSLDDLPANALLLHKVFSALHVASFVASPVIARDHCLGYIVLTSTLHKPNWNYETLSLLDVASGGLSRALEHRTASSALSVSESRYQLLIESLGEGILYCDREDIILDVNSRLCELTCYTKDELIGKAAHDLLLGAGESEHLRVRTRRRLEGISEAYEILFRRRDGTRFWARISATPIRDDQGEIIGTLGAVTDISDYKRAHVALLDSESKYRNLVETSRELIFSIDREGVWRYVNTAITDTLGFLPEEIVGTSVAEHLQWGLASDEWKNFLARLRSGESLEQELALYGKDGSVRMFSINAIPERDSSGAVTGVSGTAADITEIRATSRQLEEQRAFLRQVIDTTPNPIYAKDAEGRFVLANRALASLYGLSTDEILGKSVGDLYEDPSTIKLFAEQDRLARASGSEGREFEGKTVLPLSKEERWFHTIKKPFRSELLLGVAVDITKRRELEEALRAVVEGTATATAGEFFDSLVQHLALALSVPCAFVASVVDQQLHFTSAWMSGQTCALPSTTLTSDLVTQLSRDEIVEDASLVTNLPKEFGALTSNLLIRISARDGSLIGVLGVGLSEHGRDRSLSDYILKLFALRAGAEMERLRADSANLTLQKQLTQAQKMEAIGQLAAGIAHDLNNALGAVAGHLQLMKLQPGLNDSSQESLDIALRGCERATGLIEKLLGFARQGRYRPELIQAECAVGECLKLLGSVLGTHIRLHQEDPSEACTISADTNQLHQILTNLFLNAKQAMPNGGDLSVRFGHHYEAHPQAFNPLASPGDYVVIQIADTGDGIPSDQLDKIFEPFFTTKESSKGTGLGLAMVYGTMQSHKGWVAVESTPNHGSTFSLYFPRVAPGANDQRSDQRLTRGSAHKPLILVIDDEPFLVDLGVRFLRQSGFEAKGFSDPDRALAWYSENAHAVALTILDMKMPRIDGIECFARIRAQSPEAKIVILSGYIHDEAAQEVLNAGAVAFFQKPLKYPELMSWIQKTLHPAEEPAQQAS